MNLLKWIFLLISVLAVRSERPPQILPNAEGLSRRVVHSGSVVVFQCPVDRSQEDGIDLFFEWLRNGRPIDFHRDTRLKITNSGTLKIKEAILEDTALYTCKAVNGFGSVQINTSLIVLDNADDAFLDGDLATGDDIDSDSGHVFQNGLKPQIVQVSKFGSNGHYVQKTIGSTIKFKCVMSGHPKPTVIWYHNNLPMIDTDRGSRVGRGTLIISDLKPTDSGNYTCTGINIHGSVSATFGLQVVDRTINKPELQGQHPVNTSAAVGGTATFQCRVKSDIMPHIQWLKKVDMPANNELNSDGDDYSDRKAAANTDEHVMKINGEHYRVLTSSDVVSNGDGIFFNKLVIANVDLADSGKYICIGANVMGYSYRSAYLAVQIPSSSVISSDQNLASLPAPIIVAIGSLVIVLCFVMFGIVCRQCRLGGRTKPKPYREDSDSNQQPSPPLGRHYVYKNNGEPSLSTAKYNPMLPTTPSSHHNSHKHSNGGGRLLHSDHSSGGENYAPIQLTNERYSYQLPNGGGSFGAPVATYNHSNSSHHYSNPGSAKDSVGHVANNLVASGHLPVNHVTGHLPNSHVIGHAVNHHRHPSIPINPRTTSPLYCEPVLPPSDSPKVRHPNLPPSLNHGLKSGPQTANKPLTSFSRKFVVV